MSVAAKVHTRLSQSQIHSDKDTITPDGYGGRIYIADVQTVNSSKIYECVYQWSLAIRNFLDIYHYMFLIRNECESIYSKIIHFEYLYNSLLYSPAQEYKLLAYKRLLAKCDYLKVEYFSLKTELETLSKLLGNLADKTSNFQEKLSMLSLIYDKAEARNSYLFSKALDTQVLFLNMQGAVSSLSSAFKANNYSLDSLIWLNMSNYNLRKEEFLKNFAKNTTHKLLIHEAFKLPRKFSVFYDFDVQKRTLFGSRNSNGLESMYLSHRLNAISGSIGLDIATISKGLAKGINLVYGVRNTFDTGMKTNVLVSPVNSVYAPYNIPRIFTSTTNADFKSYKHIFAPNSQRCPIIPRRAFSDSSFYTKNKVEKLTAENLVNRITKLPSREISGSFEIIKHERELNGRKQNSWTVLIRGTQRWDADTSNIQDLATNFASVGRMDNDQFKAIRETMNTMNIASDEPVEFVGHSQGGIVATELASSHELNKRYNIVSVTTFGSPTATYEIPENVKAIHFENLSDPVPALDGKNNSVTANRTTVYMDTTDMQIDGSTHDQDLYAIASRDIEQSKNVAVQNWVKAREPFLRDSAYYKNAQYSVKSHLFDTYRW